MRWTLLNNKYSVSNTYTHSNNYSESGVNVINDAWYASVAKRICVDNATGYYA